ncbi:hypothetical protein ACFSR7_23685 [Cohnella sp. GCM10020058]|uniref:hypothetical protein n=1 Tax=Cohnella sp. GCM10020058 TaxID=3317330 RepID=UPI00362BBC4B
MNIPTELTEGLLFEGEAKEVEFLEHIIQWHESMYIEESTDYTEMQLFLQLSLFRSKLILSSFLQSCELRNPLTTALLVRTHYETTGGLAFLKKRINSYHFGGIDEDALRISVSKLLRGTRTKQAFSPIAENRIHDSVNVMTLIDAVDDFTKKQALPSPIFRECYDKLSEICHPNFIGLSIGFDLSDEGRTVRYLKDFPSLSPGHYHYYDFALSLTIFKELFLSLRLQLQEGLHDGSAE